MTTDGVNRNLLFNALVSTLVATALTGAPANTRAQANTPASAAVSALSASLSKPVKIDPRIASGGTAAGFGRLRSPDETKELARLLTAGVEQLDSVRRCDPVDPSEGVYPWSRCKLIGASSFIGVGQPTISGDSAVLEMIVWTQKNNRVQPLAMVLYEARLVRKGKDWKVVKLEVVAAT